MDRENTKDLLVRYRTGNCTEGERTLVEDWVLSQVAEPLDLSDAELLEDLLDIRARLSKELHLGRSNPTALRRWLPIAAAVALAVLVGSWLFFGDQIKLTSKIANLKSEIIVPGTNRARLTLADGRTVDLSTAQSGIIVGDEITYLDGSAVNPEAGKSERPEDHSHVGLTTYLLQLTTPKGGTYQITLPDGTKVWLNAASTLKYPSRFDENERVVELTGEAYFEVESAKKVGNRQKAVGKVIQNPFKVITNGQEIQVLGTEFNISAYADEPEIKTTLVNGAVQIVNLTSKIVNQLQPGDQSIVSEATTNIRQVETSQYTAWKSGYFSFDGTELREAMIQLGRWYDVDVIYEGQIPNMPFYGKISRSSTFDEVMDILKTGNVKFRLERRNTANRIVIIP